MVTTREVSGNLTAALLREVMTSGERLCIPLRSYTQGVGEGRIFVDREDPKIARRFILGMTFWPMPTGEIETYNEAWIDVDEDGVGIRIHAKLVIGSPLSWVPTDKTW